MMSMELLTPILEGGIRNTNFFNGRLLTAQDMSVEQQANRQQHQQLGQGIGAGVVYGLQVRTGTSSGSRPTVIVTSGLAINRRGQALSLPDELEEVEVALVREKEEIPPEAGLFAACTPLEPTATPTGTGVYVLVLSPTSGFKERAPKFGLGGNGVGRGCGSRYAVEGVRFRLAKLDLSNISISASELQNIMTADLNDAVSLSKLRNIVAHFCLGTDQVVGSSTDPFQYLNLTSSSTIASDLNSLQASSNLTDCEVPLVMLYWNSQGIRFVDNWAVRRLMRRPHDMAELPQRHHCGLERLYQFWEHIQYLTNTIDGLSAVKVQDYFLFLPPMAFFPVKSIGSLKGFHTRRFFEAFTTGSPSSISADKFSDILRSSLTYPAIYLQSKPVFQIFTVSENTAAVASGDSSQRYHVFMSRSLCGPLVQDGVAQAMQNAWKVYRGLVKRRVFLPPGTDEEKIAAQIAIVSAIRDVLEVANRQAALSKSGALDTQAALGAFQEMYDIQDELATLFQSNIPGIVHTQNREVFGQILDSRLHETESGGTSGLLPAIQAGNLIAAVDAQDGINNFVGSWTGEGVAMGFIEVRYKSSSRGIELVPGDSDPYPHTFTVVNNTDRRLTIELSGSVTAAHGDWTDSLQIRNLAGAQIESVSLESGATRDVIVEVTVPSDAQIGDEAALSIKGNVPAPHNKQGTDTLSMTVAEEWGSPIVRSVKFTQTIVPSVDTDNVNPSTPTSLTILGYAFDLRYAASEAPLSGNFTFTVTLTASPTGTMGEWFIDFAGAERNNPSQGVFTTPISLSAKAPTDTRVTVRVRTPFARGTEDKTLSFTARVESTDLPEVISAEKGPFELRLRATST